MRRILLLMTSTLTVSAFLFLLLSALSVLSEKKITESRIQHLTSSLPINIKQASDTLNKFTLINYFSPDCDHCQYMATQIAAHKNLFEDVQVYMVTSSSMESTRKFVSEYNLENLAFLNIGTDTTNDFYEQFKPPVVPTFYLYDKDQSLIKSIKGAVRIDTLINNFYTHSQ